MRSALRWMSAAFVATGISAVWSGHAFANVKIGVTVSTFGGHAWDAGLLLQRAIPLALKKGQPGTPAFREALRAALENTKDMPASHGIFNMSVNDHAGLDQRARVMVEIAGGKWKLSGD